MVSKIVFSQWVSSLEFYEFTERLYVVWQSSLAKIANSINNLPTTERLPD